MHAKFLGATGMFAIAALLAGPAMAEKTKIDFWFGNSGDIVRQMAVAGGGISRHGHFHVAADLAARRLVELLPDYHPGDGEDIHALYAPEDRAAARIRAFLDFLDEELVIEG